jgi:hypothetical protein
MRRIARPYENAGSSGAGIFVSIVTRHYGNEGNSRFLAKKSQFRAEKFEVVCIMAAANRRGSPYDTGYAGTPAY